MTAAATMSRDIGEVSLTLRAVVRDSAGMYQTIEMNGPAVDGTDYVLTGSLVDVADLANVTAPLYLVGIQAQWVSLGLNTNDPNFDVTQPVTLTLSIDNIEAVAPLYSEPLFDVPIPEVVMPLAIPTNLNWIGTGNGVGIDSLDPVDDQIHARVKTSPGTLANRVVNLAITASDTVSPVPLVVTGSVLDELALEVGDAVELQVESNIVSAYIAQRVPIVTGDTVGNATVVANISALQMGVIQSGGRTVTPSQWWASVADDHLDAYRAALPKDATMTAQSWLAEDLKNDSLRVAIQAALWLVAGAAVALAALGFAVHAIVTVRAREIELAQMRAIGVLRGQLLRVVSAENALLSALGLVFGLGLGIALSFLVAPLVSVGADGKPPLPPVIVQVPWAALGVLVGEVALVLAVSIVIVGFMLRRINPAQMLRLGDER